MANRELNLHYVELTGPIRLLLNALRMICLQCARLGPRVLHRAMASPDVFLSSPRVTRRMERAVGTSSPELPEIHDLAQAKKPVKPSLKSGSRAAAIPEDALTGFTTARGLWQTVQAAEQPSASSALQTADPIYLSGEDDSVCIIEAPSKPARTAPKPRKPRRKPEPAQSAPGSKNTAGRADYYPNSPQAHAANRRRTALGA